MANKLKLASWNMRGHREDRLLYLRTLMSQCDLLFLQEHWCLDQEIQFLTRYVDDANVIGISSIDESQLLSGRPFGGCALVYKKSLACNVSLIPTHSKRLLAVSCSLSCGFNALLLNVYMPCDSRSPDNQLTEFTNILCEIDAIISMNNCPEFVILGGDLNTDLSRVNSSHTKTLIDFCSTNDLKFCVSTSLSSVTFTYENESSGVRSLIDHFVVSDNLFDEITHYSALDHGHNPSDHCPVLLQLSTSAPHLSLPTSPTNNVTVPWATASMEQIELYKSCLDANLAAVEIPSDALTCADVFCRAHNSQVQEYFSAILDACKAAAERSIGFKRSRRAKTLPGWNEFVKPYQEKAILWHAIWKSSGRPREGTIASIRRRTRAKYRYAIRYIKKNEDACRARSMADALLQNRSRDMWNEVCKVSSKKTMTASRIDGTDGDAAIADVFASKAEELFNSVSYDREKMITLLQGLDDDIEQKCVQTADCYHPHSISVADVEQALKCLKQGKKDGTCEFGSDFLLNATPSLHTHLSLLFKVIFQHGVFPEEFCMSTVLPLPKNKKKALTCSDNYRSIALGSIIGKLFDIVLLRGSASVLNCSDWQYGFREDHSTTQCTFVLNETVQYYLNGNSSVHVMLLDASKAFDRVEYTKLFAVLRSKGLCPMVSRILAKMYQNQTLRVKWNAAFSRNIPVSNGVKQGGVISPVLFTNYIDELLQRLKQSRYGCYIGSVFCGGFGYADDVALLAPTRVALKAMLQICDQFASEYDILFNAEKSKYLLFNPNRKVSNSSINWKDQVMTACSDETHLGTPIGTTNNANALLVKKSLCEFYTRFNYVFKKFHHCDLRVKYALFKSLCMSVYGSQLWDYSARTCDMFFVAWRKAIRRLLKVPSRTHNVLLPLIVNDAPVEAQLHKRFIKFFHKALRSGNDCTRTCAQLALNTSHSSVSNSVHFLCQLYQIPVSSLLKSPLNVAINCIFSNQPDDTDLVKAGAILDFLSMRQNCDKNDFCNLSDIINHLCCN